MGYKISYLGDRNIRNVHHIGYFEDRLWNEGSLSRALKSKRAAKVIASAIAEFA